MYQFSILTNSHAVFFEKLTYPIYRPILQVLDNNSSILAIGVNLQSQPIGLGLAVINEHKAELLSLFIHPEYRGQGLGKTLLKELEEELKKRNCLEILVIYTSNKTTIYFEHILQQMNWITPQLRMLICDGLIKSFQNLPWLHIYQGLPSSYTLIPWIKLTQQDRKFIQTINYPKILSPFEEEDIIEPINSLGLRYQDQIVGWMITHRIAKDTIRYTKLFVKEELQSKGKGMYLLSRAIELNLKKFHNSKVSFTVHADNSSMVQIMNKRLAKYLNNIRHSYQSLKYF